MHIRMNFFKSYHFVFSLKKKVISPQNDISFPVCLWGEIWYCWPTVFKLFFLIGQLTIVIIIILMLASEIMWNEKFNETSNIVY